MKFEVADGTNCREADAEVGRTIGIRQAEDDGLWVAAMEGDWVDGDPRKLATLFAAAPELLAVVEMAQIEALTLEPRLTAPFAGTMRILAERCKEAIAKATVTP